MTSPLRTPGRVGERSRASDQTAFLPPWRRPSSAREQETLEGDNAYEAWEMERWRLVGMW